MIDKETRKDCGELYEKYKQYEKDPTTSEKAKSIIAALKAVAEGKEGAAKRK